MEAVMPYGTDHYVHAFARSRRDEEAIGLLRCRLLCGRTPAEVDRIHKKALEKVARHHHDGLFVKSAKLVPILLAELEARVIEPEDSHESILSRILHSSWDQPCGIASGNLSFRRITDDAQ